MVAGDKQPTKAQLGNKKKSLKAATLASEQASAERLGGGAQPASGAQKAHKGDIKLDDFLIDKKETSAQSILIHGKDLTKITREADGEGRTPALLVQLEGIPSTVSGQWIMIPVEKFAELFVG